MDRQSHPLLRCQLSLSAKIRPKLTRQTEQEDDETADEQECANIIKFLDLLHLGPVLELVVEGRWEVEEKEEEATPIGYGVV